MNIITISPSCIVHSIIRLLIISIFLSGCTTLKPIEMDSNTLQDKIRNGEIVKTGDRVRVITTHGSTHILTVIEISEHVLTGELEGTGTPYTWTGSEDGMYEEDAVTEATAIEIPIDDIVLVEGEEFSAGKTALAVGGGITTIVIVAIIIFLATFSI